MSFNSLENVLERRARKKAFSAARAIFVVQKTLGSQAQAVSLKDGSLKVRVSSSVSAAKIKEQEKELMENINRVLGTEAVKKIFFRVGE